MILSLPKYYSNSKVFAELLKSFTAEINRNNYNIADLENQLFIDTATRGLDLWEKELNIYTDLAKPYTDRREAIKARLRGSGTCTIEMVKNTALAYTNAEIDVIEDNPNYAFVVKFVGVKGVPRDIKAFKNTIDTIKPAHLTYTIEYSYTVWSELQNATWADVKLGTWSELKTRMVI